MINLCVTTFNRQDMLSACLRSACVGSVKPDKIYVVDQSKKGDVQELIWGLSLPIHVEIINLGEKRGCEASAINWYLTNVPEERVIAHDDVAFGHLSLEKFVQGEGAFLIDETQGIITYRDVCIERVGLYDTEMSPNYFRYVDADYEDRLADIGIFPVVVACGVSHSPGGTMRGFSEEEMAEYYRRNGIANDNYERKHGRPLTPGGSTIGRANWRRQQL